jgi:ribosome modulation factor
MADQMIMAMADAWLAGWEAAKLGKPESICPFKDNFAALWLRGWEAGLRGSQRDHAAKRRFLGISIGVTVDLHRAQSEQT